MNHIIKLYILYIFHKHAIYVFRIILEINTDYSLTTILIGLL